MTNLIQRRRALALLGGAGASAFLIGKSDLIETVDAATCVPSTPTVTEGPYWVDEKLFRSDIRTDPATGTARPGVPLNLTINVQNNSNGTCGPLAGALVDIWHCDAIGIYSDEPAYNPGGGTGTVVTTGQKVLRGYQVTDDNGQVQFLTIFPGWYGGRTIHIHVRVRTYQGATLLDNFVSQLFFDDTISNAVLAIAPYSNRTTRRDTTNSNDMVYTQAQNSSRMLLALEQSGSGYSGAITLGVTMKAAAAAVPAVSSGGVANAASGAAGVTPGSWISIYGTNLATAARTMTTADLVNNTIPTSLGGVGVQIDGKAAFVYYVSPSLINVVSPADTNVGTVAITVTNSAGTSQSASATMQSALPGLFVLSNYVRAVRFSDGAIISEAKPGEVIELYGTGFGPTSYSGDAGAIFSGAFATTNKVTVTIGGAQADVSFAGLIGPGLYQINLAVPAGLAAGDQQVIATVNGLSSSAALLKIAT